jgi:hypothetical protein
MRWHCCRCSYSFRIITPTKLIILLWTSYSCTGPGILRADRNKLLFYNLKFTEVYAYINLENMFSLAELYVKSVYLNLFWWRGGVKFMTHFKGEKV